MNVKCVCVDTDIGQLIQIHHQISKLKLVNMRVRRVGAVMVVVYFNSRAKATVLRMHYLQRAPNDWTIQSICRCQLVSLPAVIWPKARYSYQHLSQHHPILQSTAIGNKCVAIYSLFESNDRHDTHLSAMTQQMSATFDDLPIDGGYAAGNRFHRLEECIQY